MNNTLSLEFEILSTEIAAQAFPEFRFSLTAYQPQNQKKVSLKLQGHRNYPTNTLVTDSSDFHQQSTISFDLDFYPHSRCLSLETRFHDKKYCLFYHSIGYLFWSINNRRDITPPSTFEKEFEFIGKKLYPILEEFFLG
ncbi:hypothetical protein WA1_35230 [Scytonema hofmannii PCC 7110]|uniref:Uncharacterized protein n=1 Tax=Scytonema hofmannii PCC 7110 TaxID=128403 RepID=A0A139X1C0_9CYAN|nr:hypothetical protein [Scytonema hofmannii]KYC38453.1 hypothetical protein WA1_35230 [Scytonema hofmannii PCC 7110]